LRGSGGGGGSGLGSLSVADTAGLRLQLLENERRLQHLEQEHQLALARARSQELGSLMSGQQLLQNEDRVPQLEPQGQYFAQVNARNQEMALWHSLGLQDSAPTGDEDGEQD
jgi:hypothetical protein